MEDEQIRNDAIASPLGRHEFAQENSELLKIMLFVMLAIAGIVSFGKKVDEHSCQTIQQGGNIEKVLKEIPNRSTLQSLQQFCGTKGLQITEDEIRKAISSTLEEGGVIPPEIFTSEPSDK